MAGLSSRGRALTDLILEVFRLNGKLIKAGDHLTLPFAQTSSRWQVLGALAGGPATVPVVARSMGISRQSVQRLADLLVGEKLCEFVVNPHHQKSAILRLTADGKRVLKKISTVQISWANKIAAQLPGGQIVALTSLLKNISELLDRP